jgi:hypothetical protein
MTNVIQGRDVLLLIYNSTDYVPYLCSKDVSISTSSSFVQVTTVGDGKWKKFEEQDREYSVTLSGVATFTPTAQIGDAVNTFDLVTYQINGTQIRFKMIFIDEEHQNLKLIRGYFYIETSNLAASVGQPLMTDFSFKGSGAYTLFDCDVTFETLTAIVTGNSVSVTIGGIDGTVSSWKYSLDGATEATTTSNPFTIGSLSTGAHSVTVTAICPSGLRGESKYVDFFVEIPVPSPPTANAGTDQNITLPTNSVLLSGSGTSPGTIIGYNWSKISGPASYSIVNPNAQNTNVNGLLAGTYVFLLTVTDSNGNTANDNVSVFVIPEPSQSQFQAFWTWTTSDPYSALLVSDGLTYEGSGFFDVGTTVYAAFAGAPTQQFWVMKEPSSEPLKTNWFNTPFNYGTIPDSSLRDAFITGGFRYYVARQQFDMDTTVTTAFSG